MTLAPRTTFLLALLAPLPAQGEVVEEFARTAAAAEKLARANDLAKAKVAVGRAMELFRALAADDVSKEVAKGLRQIAYTSFLTNQPAISEVAYRASADWLAANSPTEIAMLQLLRCSQARARLVQGDAKGTLEIIEPAYAILEKVLPKGHFELENQLRTLSYARYQNRDYQGACAAQLSLIEKVRARLAETDPRVLDDRRLLGQILHRLGDAQGAFVVFESIHAIESKLLDRDSWRLQLARQNLASAMNNLGDLEGARDLMELVLEVRTRTMKPDNPRLLGVQQDLGYVLARMGELERAREIQERVLAAKRKVFPEDHKSIQRAYQHLAYTLRRLGDEAGAVALQEPLHEALNRTRPANDRDRLLSCLNLGGNYRALGRLKESKKLLTEALERLQQRFPTKHIYVQTARRALVSTLWHLDEFDAAVDLAVTTAAVSREVVRTTPLAVRPAAEQARRGARCLDHLLSMAIETTDEKARERLLEAGLWTSQVLRGIETRVARLVNSIRATRADDVARLEAELAESIAAINRAAAGATANGGKPSRTGLGDAVRQKEQLQRRLLQLGRVDGTLPAPPTLDAIAAALPPKSAAAAFVSFLHRTPDPDNPGRFRVRRRVVSLLLTRDMKIHLLDIGTLRDVQAQVADLRLATYKKIRRRILDPVLGTAGAIDRLFVALDESLELLPIDALPLSSGEPVGTAVAIHRLTSLIDLAETDGPSIGESPRLVALGGVDYVQSAAAATAKAFSDCLAPPVRAMTGADGYAPLEGSEAEVQSIVASFQTARKNGTAVILSGLEANKPRLLESSRGATFLHLATHGYFAPPTVVSRTDVDDAAGDDLQSRVAGLSPLVLCGLALSGANQGPDSSGRVPGIITAEELMTLDLSDCYLAVLSACDSSKGVRRAGQGHASLHAAIHGAGARFVVSSLWKVGDDTTREVMTDFYKRLWANPDAPHRALWDAKMAARRRGVAFRDWAGWVLTGR